VGNGEGGGGGWNMGDVWGSWAARNLKKWALITWSPTVENMRECCQDVGWFKDEHV
jgi:hypothetical protein